MNEIVFQVLDWNPTHEIDDNDKKNYIVQLFGRTLKNNKTKTIHCKVTGFQPFFYVEIPDHWKLSTLQYLINHVKRKVYPKDNVDGLVKYQIVKKQKFYGFTNGKEFQFALLKFSNYDSFRSYERVFEKPIENKMLGKYSEKYKIYESNIEPHIRLMHIQNLSSVGWIKINNYEPLDDNSTTCQINITTDWKNLQRYETNNICPFVIASFDIECTSEDGSFPQAKRENDKITKIGTTFSRVGETECFKKHMVSLKSCDPLNNVELISCKNEKDVLLEWTKMIIKEDPDIIIGYNINGFDFQYLRDRAEFLGILKKFSCLSRNINEESQFKIKQLASSALGENILKYFDMKGRIIIDLMKVIQRDYKLSSYKLDSVASSFIKEDIVNITYKDKHSIIETKNVYGIEKEQYITINYYDGISDNKYLEGKKFQIKNIMEKKIEVDGIIEHDIMEHNYKVYWCQAKDDVSPKDLFRMEKGNSNDRMKIAKYCIQDCELCNKLIAKLQIVVNNISMANVCSVPLSYIFMRGQGVKIFSLVSKKCREKNHLIPVIRKKNIDRKAQIQMEKFIDKLNNNNLDEDDDEYDDWYEGARVIPPKVGVHYDPIIVLDYSSLYPSSMIEMGLCPSLFVMDEQYDNLPDIKYNTIKYEIYHEKPEPEKKTKRKKNIKNKKKEKEDMQIKEIKICKFAIKKDGTKGIIPEILTDLLTARNQTKNELEKAKDPFMKSILNGLQLAFKITANSLYGQTGAPTSPIYLKDIAACTTATGRERLDFSKDFIEIIYNDLIKNALLNKSKFKKTFNNIYVNAKNKKYKNINLFYESVPENHFNKEKKGYTNIKQFRDMFYSKINELLKDIKVKMEVIYGDTDSVFFNPHMVDIKTGKKKQDKEALKIAIELGKLASDGICALLREPQAQIYEKTLWPFAILTKKRYVGNLYEFNVDKYEQKSMGIVLKRRDNAPIVKTVVGGIIDQILNKKNIDGAIKFTDDMLKQILLGKFPIYKFIITKTLKYTKPEVSTPENDYADRTRIVQAVLADRMAERDPGNKPMSNDRIPYVYVIPSKKKIKLQGERVEHPDYVVKNKLPIDYLFYITNQIKKPALQFLELVVENPNIIFRKYILREESRRHHKHPVSYYINLK